MANDVGLPKSAAAKGTGWAWGICWLMFACTVLNYTNRQAMAVVGPDVMKQFSLDKVGYGWVLAAFQLTYAFFQWPAGYFVDRWDVRKTYAAAVVWWSLAGIATAFSPTLAMLFVFRALLGVGESFNWPCGLRVTAGVLPPSDRGLGNGIFNSGAAVGAVLTPLIIVPLAVKMGWRAPFVVLGVAGLIWGTAWMWLTRGRTMTVPTQGAKEKQHGLTSPARMAFAGLVLIAVALIVAGWFWVDSGLLPETGTGAPSVPQRPYFLSSIWVAVATLMIGVLIVARALPVSSLAGADWARSLGDVVRRRRFWVMMSVGVTINVSWHYLVNWMTNFFQDAKGLNLGLLIGGVVAAVPFLAADGGNLGGGWLTRRLVRGGFSTTTARKIVLCLCMVLISCAVGVGIVVAERPTAAAGSTPNLTTSFGLVLSTAWAAIRENALVIGLLALTAMGAAAYMVNYFAFCQDVATEHTGLVIGYLGGLGNLFAAGFLPLAGWIAQKWSFAPNFVIVGLLPLIGLITLLVAWGRDPEA